jgi:hypothetical protein
VSTQFLPSPDPLLQAKFDRLVDVVLDNSDLDREDAERVVDGITVALASFDDDGGISPFPA